jgi:hypothetical protein
LAVDSAAGEVSVLEVLNRERWIAANGRIEEPGAQYGANGSRRIKSRPVCQLLKAGIT